MVEKQLSENIFEHRQNYNTTIWPNRDRILKATAGSRIWPMAHMMCWLLCWIEGLHVILRSQLDKTCPALRHQQRMGRCPPLSEVGWHQVVLHPITIRVECSPLRWWSENWNMVWICWLVSLSIEIVGSVSWTLREHAHVSHKLRRYRSFTLI